jgi:hypothetical protein
LDEENKRDGFVESSPLRTFWLLLDLALTSSSQNQYLHLCVNIKMLKQKKIIGKKQKKRNRAEPKTSTPDTFSMPHFKKSLPGFSDVPDLHRSAGSSQ